MVNALLLAKKYLQYHMMEHNDVEALKLLSEDVCGYGTNQQERYYGKKQMAEAFAAQKGVHLKPYKVRVLEGENLPQTPDVSIARLNIEVDNGEVVTECRMTVCARIEQGKECISNIHISIPSRTENEGTYFPRVADEKMNELRSEFAQESQEEKERIAQLEKEEIQLRMLLEEKAVLVWEYDVVNKRIYKNRLVKRKAGDSGIVENVPDAVLAAGRIHPDSVDAYREMYQRLQEGAEKVVADVCVKDADGKKWIWQRISYYNTFRDGKPYRAYAAEYNISAERDRQKWYEKEIAYRDFAGREAEFFLQFDLEQDTVLECSFLSDTKKRNKIKTIEDFQRLEARNISDAKQKNRFMAQLDPENLRKEYDAGHHNIRFEYQRKEKEKNTYWVSCEIHLIGYSKTMEIIGFLYVYNINQNRLQKVSMERIANQEVDMIAFFGCDDRELTVIRGNLAQVNHFIDKSGGIQEIIRKLSEEEYFSNVLASDYDGSKQRLRAYFLDETKQEIVLVSNDITREVRKEEQKNLQLQEALEETRQANEAKSDFLSRMSHDLRTPLNGIIGLAELGRDDAILEVTRSSYEKIVESGKYLLGLLNDVLSMSKIEQGQITLNKENIESAEFVEAIRATLVSVSNKSEAEFKFESLIKETYICIDSLKIQQVIVNLVNNALKFTPKDGMVLCRLVEDKAEKPGTILLKIMVSDTGRGMSSEFQQRMFQPFEQENSSTTGKLQGTGLGLAIVHSMVTLMGGEVTCQSCIGEGTTFHVVIPVEIPDNVQRRQIEQKAEDIRNEQEDMGILEGKRILLAEDNMLNAEVAERILKKKGLEVDWVKDGEQAVCAFRQNIDGYYQAILMDVQMPVMDGLTATKTIRSLGITGADTIPIIAMTANAYEEDVRRSLEAGMNAHLSKPINTAALFSTLVKWMK